MQVELYAQAAELFRQLAEGPEFYRQLGSYYAAHAFRKHAEKLAGEGKLSAAIQCLERALEANPAATSTRTLLAECHARAGDYAAAGRQHGQLADAGFRIIDSRIKQAMGLFVAGQVKPAIALLERLNAEQPNHFQTCLKLGMLLAADGEFDRAARYLTHAANLQPKSAEPQWRLGLAHAACGRLIQAFHHLQQAHLLEPASPLILRTLLILVAQAKRAGTELEAKVVPAPAPASTGEISLEELSSRLSREPELATAFLALPPGELDRQIFPAVLEAVRSLLREDPARADLQFLASRLADRLGDADRSLEHVRQALELNPRYTDALIHLAGLYSRSGRRAEAISRLKTAVALGANYPDVHYTLGQLFQQLGHLGEARVHYRRALAINSNYAAAKEALAALAA